MTQRDVRGGKLIALSIVVASVVASAHAEDGVVRNDNSASGARVSTAISSSETDKLDKAMDEVWKRSRRDGFRSLIACYTAGVEDVATKADSRIAEAETAERRFIDTRGYLGMGELVYPACDKAMTRHLSADDPVFEKAKVFARGFFQYENEKFLKQCKSEFCKSFARRLAEEE